MATIEQLKRVEKGKKAAMLNIVVGIALFIFKLLAGVFGKSSALISDAFHSLADTLTSFVVFFGFHISLKPADEEHQYGHGDAEAVAAFIVSLFILLTGIELLRYAAKRFFSPGKIEHGALLIGALIISILLKYISAKYMEGVGREIESKATLADVEHARSDIFSSFVALFGVAGSVFGYAFLDPLSAIFISFLILYQGVVSSRESIDMITGMVRDKEIIEKIKEVASSVEGVKGVHGIKVHYFGAYANVELHVEVDKNKTVKEADLIAHKVQGLLVKEIGDVKSAIIHVCPFKHD